MRRAEVAGRLALPLAIVVTLVAYAGSLGYGFVADARFLIADNRYLDGWSYFWPTLTHDYFWSSSGATIPYWRPVTKLSWLVEAQLFGRGAAPFHAVQLGWLVLAVAGVYALARRLGASQPWAGAAAILLALHPTVIEPACLLMARSDVTALGCTLWAIVAWHAWQTAEARRRRVAWAALHVVACALALGSKESSVLLPAVLTAWALALGLRGRALGTLAPSWLLTLVYLGLRARVLHVPTPGASFDALRLFVGLGAYGWALLPLRLSSPLHNISQAEAHAASTLLVASLVWLALVAGTAAALWRRKPAALGLVALGVASLMPVLLGPTPHVPGAAGKYALADRWAITAAAALAVGLALAAKRLRPRLAAVAAAALALWTLGALVLAPTLHGYYRSDETLLALEDLQYEELPARFRTVEDRCRARDRQMARAVAAGDADAALALVRAAPAECPVGAADRFNLLSALVQRGRFAEARPLVEPLLSKFSLDRRYLGPAEYLAGVTLVETGDPARGEQLLLSALRGGVHSCALIGRLAEAAARQGHADDAARRRAQYESCRAAAR